MLLASDRLDLLQVFLRVAETGQISGAANLLGLSQPTASRLLRRLEVAVGQRLFDRLPQGLRLSQAGHDFLAPARRLVEDWQAAVDGLKADGSAVSGTIRVAAPIAVGQSFLAAIAASFLRDHPDVSIEWHLRDDALDVAPAATIFGSGPAMSTATTWWCGTSTGSSARSWPRPELIRSPIRAISSRDLPCGCPPSCRARSR